MPEILSVLGKDIRPPASSTSQTGRRGERLAAEFLESNGYRLVLSNFKVPIGRNRRGAAITGEVDIVAFEDDILCFVEVKTRTSDTFAAPLATVTLRKQRQITRTARVYKRIFRVYGIKHRFDVVSIVMNENSMPQIDLFRGFWSEHKFRKRAWSGDVSY